MHSYTKLQMYNRVTIITTWNIWDLYIGENLVKVEIEMNRLQIEILGLSEIRWRWPKHEVLEHQNHYNGMATLISSSIEKSVIDFFLNIIEEFHTELEEAIKLTMKGEIIIVGNFGLGDSINREDHLIKFCKE